MVSLADLARHVKGSLSIFRHGLDHLAPSIAPEMLGAHAAGARIAGQRECGAEGGRAQIPTPAVVLCAAPSLPDGHNLEINEPLLLEIIARMTQ